jgi:hypothetical protein
MAKKSFTMNSSSSASKMICIATSRGSIAAADYDQTTGKARSTLYGTEQETRERLVKVDGRGVSVSG